MSPEVALLVRAALLGLLVVALERFGRRRQAKRAEAERTIIRLPAARRPEKPLAGRPLQVTPQTTLRPHTDVTASAQVNAESNKIVRLKSSQTVNTTVTRCDGHVTEKRAA